MTGIVYQSVYTYPMGYVKQKTLIFIFPNANGI